MTRLTAESLFNNPKDALIAMADGNPGAITAMIGLMEASPKVDPQSAFGPMTPLIGLDSLAIYGTDVWVLFKDVCGQDITCTLAVLRAHQLGILTSEEIKDALTQGVSEEKTALRDRAETIVEDVQARLDEFAQTEDN